MQTEPVKPDRPKAYIPCFLCGEGAEIKYSKKDKPYFICDPCGLQAFIRKDRGISKLGGLTKPRIFEKTRVLDILDTLGALKLKLSEINSAKPLFSKAPDLEVAEKALLAEKTRLEKELNQLARISDKPGNSKGQDLKSKTNSKG
jgi:hypothetical protein